MNIINAESEIKKIIVKLHSVQPAKISSDTDLFKDLGIDGDDAVEIFEVISETFEVDFTGIEWEYYFGPEAGFNPLELLSLSWWKWHRNRIPVTIHDLAKAVIEKRWILRY